MEGPRLKAPFSPITTSRAIKHEDEVENCRSVVTGDPETGIREREPAGYTWGVETAEVKATRHVEDLAGNSAEVAAMSFTHLAGEDGQVLIARQAASESVPVAASAYGLTTLFQGRTWHGDLGMYYYRARWHLPEAGVFGERDPVGYHDSVSFYQSMMNSPFNWADPWGSNVVPEPPPPKPLFPFIDPDAVPEVPPGSPVDGMHGPRAPGMWAAGNLPTADVDNGPYSAHLTIGASAEFWGANSFVQSSTAPGGNGRHCGINFQFWVRKHHKVFGAFFIFDSKRAAEKFSTPESWFDNLVSETGAEGCSTTIKTERRRQL